MKLTNTMRDAFVRQVMDDVPQMDYDEQIRKAAVKAALSLVPPVVKKAWEDKESNGFVETTTIYGSTIPSPRGWTDKDVYHNKVREVPELKELVNKRDAQRDSRRALTEKLRSVAYSVTTVKMLKEAMPEFAKYLPADQPTAVRTLPVVANVVNELVKAGWPKDQKK